jgi:seryl-tRNA synthetase
MNDTSEGPFDTEEVLDEVDDDYLKEVEASLAREQKRFEQAKKIHREKKVRQEKRKILEYERRIKELDDEAEAAENARKKLMSEIDAVRVSRVRRREEERNLEDAIFELERCV